MSCSGANLKKLAKEAKKHMMLRCRLLLSFVVFVFFVAGCSGPWRVAYDSEVDAEIASDWRLSRVSVVVPDTLSVSDENKLAPNADIVWHGDRPGDRRSQVAAILREGLTKGASELSGNRPVIIALRLHQFHAVTPAAVSIAPSAVHNIQYVAQIYDARSREPLTEPQMIKAALEARVGASAVIAAVEGQTQRVRIVDHLAAVTRGWLGLGADQRRTFAAIGR